MHGNTDAYIRTVEYQFRMFQSFQILQHARIREGFQDVLVDYLRTVSLQIFAALLIYICNHAGHIYGYGSGNMVHEKFIIVSNQFHFKIPFLWKVLQGTGALQH